MTCTCILSTCCPLFAASKVAEAIRCSTTAPQMLTLSFLLTFVNLWSRGKGRQEMLSCLNSITSPRSVAGSSGDFHIQCNTQATYICLCDGNRRHDQIKSTNSSCNLLLTTMTLTIPFEFEGPNISFSPRDNISQPICLTRHKHASFLNSSSRSQGVA